VSSRRWSCTLALVPTKEAPLALKWILIGAVVQGSLCWLLREMLVQPVLLPLMESMGAVGGLLTYAVLVAFGAFFGGGLVVAYFSPGDTIKEPAIAATLAISFNEILRLTWDEAAQFSLLGTGIAVALAYAFALAGAKLGEKLQGDTTDKMRDRGTLLK
jgi:hypothetical protein